MVTINNRVLKRMAIIQSYRVLHFIKSAMNLSKKIAIRSQFSLEGVDGFTSYEVVEFNHDKKKDEIHASALHVARLLCKLNASAINAGYGEIVEGLQEKGLSEVITIICNHLKSLMDDSDFRLWLDEFEAIEVN